MRLFLYSWAGSEVDLWEVKVSDGIGLIKCEAQENDVVSASRKKKSTWKFSYLLCFLVSEISISLKCPRFQSLVFLVRATCRQRRECSIGETILTGEYRSTVRRTCPSATLSTTTWNRTWTSVVKCWKLPQQR